MTIQEMHDVMDLKLDKSGNDWYTPEEKDVWINLAINQFVKEKHDMFEATEKIRTALHSLVRTLRIPGVRQINLFSLVPNYMYTLSLAASWNNDCYPGGVKSVPIRSVQIDDIEKMKMDPFDSPIDDSPAYVQDSADGLSSPVFNIFSDTIPDEITFRYLIEPDVVDINTGVDCNLHPSVHEEIIDIAVNKSMIPIQDEMYPVQKQEQIENNS